MTFELPLDQIICGDNCDVLGAFPRNCIDLVVTSPPYDDLRAYGGARLGFLWYRLADLQSNQTRWCCCLGC